MPCVIEFFCSFEKRLIREIASLEGGAKTPAETQVLCCVEKGQNCCMDTQFLCLPYYRVHFFIPSIGCLFECVSSRGKSLDSVDKCWRRPYCSLRFFCNPHTHTHSTYSSPSSLSQQQRETAGADATN